MRPSPIPSLPRIEVEVAGRRGSRRRRARHLPDRRAAGRRQRGARGRGRRRRADREPTAATFTARVHPQTTARPGSALQLAVDPSKFHYFDPATGLRLEPARELVTA